VFHIFAVLAEFERDVIRERTLAGLQAARTRSRTGGRHPALKAKDPEITVHEVATRLGETASALPSLDLDGLTAVILRDHKMREQRRRQMREVSFDGDQPALRWQKSMRIVQAHHHAGNP
jgi:Resolvase, N terminal domain